MLTATLYISKLATWYRYMAHTRIVAIVRKCSKVLTGPFKEGREEPDEKVWRAAETESTAESLNGKVIM